MTNTKHTALPWRIGVRQPDSCKFIYDAKGGEVANCDMLTNFADDNLANAAFIVRACNAHDELVAVIEALGEFGRGGYFNKSLLDADWCARAKAVLAKAREE